MKRIIYIAGLAIFTLLVASCAKKAADTSTLDGKRARLKELGDEAVKIKTEMATLELEIQKMDPASKAEKVTAVVTETIDEQRFIHSIDLQGTVKSED